MALKRNYTLSDLNNEVYYFDSHWRRIFKNDRAVYVATKNNASLTISIINAKGDKVPKVIQYFKKGSRIVVIGLAVHAPAHTTKNL